jgi:hypothetical protein
MATVAEAQAALARIRACPDGGLLSPEGTATLLGVPPAVVVKALEQGQWGWQIQLALLEYQKRRQSELRKTIGIYNIELTNYCNMKCSYCPQPLMGRKKGHMSAEILTLCIERYLQRRILPRLVINNFGEPLLHPDLDARLRQIAAAGIDIELNTNGLLLEKKLPILLAIPCRIDVALSVHQWVGQGPQAYFEALGGWQRRVAGSNVTFYQASNATEKKFSFHAWSHGPEQDGDPQSYCEFLWDNRCTVLWNGDMTSCCIDCDGESAFANITDPGSAATHSRPWRGCRTCDYRHAPPIR